MPTYDYVCKRCRRRFTAFQRITARPLRTCPHCKKGKPERLIGPGAGLLFKGTGFYITDYKKSGGRRQETGEKKKKDPDGGTGSARSTPDSGPSKSDNPPSGSKPEQKQK